MSPGGFGVASTDGSEFTSPGGFEVVSTDGPGAPRRAHHVFLYCTVILSTSIVRPLTCGVDVPVVTVPTPGLTPLIFIV